MVDSAAAVPGCAWPVDAGRCTPKGNSGRATGPFWRVPSCTAGRVQTGAGVVESAIRPGLYNRSKMRRAVHTLLLTALLFALTAPVALAHDGGEGLYGETNDKVVTNAGFIIIAAFPFLVFLLSMLMWVLDKRKDRRKKAAKARTARADARGGW